MERYLAKRAPWALAGCLASVACVACDPLSPADETNDVAETGSAATDRNGLPVNGLPANGLPVNGLPANGLNANGLPVNGLNSNGLNANGLDASSTFENWFHWFTGCGTADG